MVEYMTGLRNTAVGLTMLALMGFALPNPAKAGFEEGVKAYEAKDYKTALDEWLPLAKANDPAAMRNVGHLYRRGLGTQQDFKKALTWYKRAATMGFDRAQANVAGMYLNGEGVERDFLQAASWFAKAAEQGHVLARYNLGLMFETGLGVSKNLDKAKALFELAAGDGHPQAKERLAILAAQQDKPKDPDKEIVVAIEKPPEAPEPPAPATPPAAATSNSTEAAKPAVSAPAKAAIAPPAPNPAAEGAPKVATNTTANSSGSVQKKGFYEALKSLKAKKPAAATSVPAIAAASTEASKSAPKAKIEAAESQKAAITTTAKEPEIAETLKTKPSAPAKAEPEKPVVVASAPPPPAPKPAPAVSSVANGLTLEEKLEMADLAFALKEYQQSLSIWAILAQEGHAEAQYKLGTMFHNGLAVPVDRVRAYIWWEKAKDNGYAEAAPALAGLEKSLTHMEKRQIQRTN